MSAHTPGPWTVKEWELRDSDGATEAGGLQVVDANGYSIDSCTIESASSAQEADVYLIAAAPELLAALKGLDEAFCSINEFSTKEERHSGRMALIAARAAIAKAIGAPA